MAGKYTENGIVTKDKYGDWCVPPESKELIHAKDTNRITDGKLIAAATYIQLLTTMQDFAQILGKNEDKKAWASLSLTMQKAFNQQFLKREKTQYSNGTVTANLLPIVYNIVPTENKKAVFNALVDNILNENKGHISTGVIGTQWLMRGLTQNGRADIAYQIATNTDYPSWGYMAENGATTIWELWNGNTANPEMNSANHVMLLGDLIIWYYENLAGIKSGSEAFKTIEMKPEFIEKLYGVKASYHSIRGEISSEWKNEAGKFTWKISIPANTKALVYLPTNFVKNIKESNQNLSQNKSTKFLKIEQNRVVLEVESGDYFFTVQ